MACASVLILFYMMVDAGCRRILPIPDKKISAREFHEALISRVEKRCLAE
jgi:hypothetical protein